MEPFILFGFALGVLALAVALAARWDMDDLDIDGDLERADVRWRLLRTAR